ncbi:MAG: glutamate--cysteine ligase [Patescibacteria group bacterium]|mgnify:CR=1 FL=1
MLQYLVEKFTTHQKKIDEWFSNMEEKIGGDPVYASVDLRNAGYKIAPVDTNIFPGGFNNLCPSSQREAGKLFREYIQKYYAEARRIAILAEEHTRNLYYFENLYHLSSLIKAEGFEVEIASLSADLPQDKNEFATAEKNTITIWKASVLNNIFKISPFSPDLILVNNDFSGGVPDAIKNMVAPTSGRGSNSLASPRLGLIVQPMVPTPLIGWHARRKSDHFSCYQSLSHEFAKLIDIDPWIIFAPFSGVDEIDFGDSQSMEKLAAKVDEVIKEIQPKYKEYKIPHEPFVFVKNDAGTYGMAVMTAKSGDELLHLNKKARNEMKVGKGKRLVTEVIIQEGIPTIDRFKGLTAEPVIYLVNNQVSGAFFRLNENADDRSNLNQPGMKFAKLCFHEMMGYSSEYNGECDLECLGMVYKNIARIASLAAGCEIRQLEKVAPSGRIIALSLAEARPESQKT